MCFVWFLVLKILVVKFESHEKLAAGVSGWIFWVCSLGYHPRLLVVFLSTSNFVICLCYSRRQGKIGDKCEREELFWSFYLFLKKPISLKKVNERACQLLNLFPFVRFGILGRKLEYLFHQWRYFGTSMRILTLFFSVCTSFKQKLF